MKNVQKIGRKIALPKNLILNDVSKYIQNRIICSLDGLLIKIAGTSRDGFQSTGAISYAYHPFNSSLDHFSS